MQADARLPQLDVLARDRLSVAIMTRDGQDNVVHGDGASVDRRRRCIGGGNESLDHQPTVVGEHIAHTGQTAGLRVSLVRLKNVLSAANTKENRA